MSPVHDPGHHLAVEVSEDCLECLAVLGHRLRQARGDVAGNHSGHDATLADALPIVGHPIGDAMEVRTHLRGLDVAE